MAGASSWLNAMPLAEHGFILSKRQFRDGLALRFNDGIKRLPGKCPCGQKLDFPHAINCKRGDFAIMRLNDIRDFETKLLKKVYKNVEIEPPLQVLTNEHLRTGSINKDSARLDVRTCDFWRRGQNTFIDVRVKNPGDETQAQELTMNKS